MTTDDNYSLAVIYAERQTLSARGKGGTLAALLYPPVFQPAARRFRAAKDRNIASGGFVAVFIHHDNIGKVYHP